MTDHPSTENVTEPRDWLIRKRGYYYRPNRAGYTSNVAEAGHYTETEAKSEAAIEPGCMSAVHLSEVTPPSSKQSDGVQRYRPYYWDTATQTGHPATMRANSEGAWVAWHDYEALSAELSQLRATTPMPVQTEVCPVCRTVHDKPLCHTPQSPIAQVIVREDGPADVMLYAPGLPPGEHDLYCEPPAPGGQKVPHPCFAGETKAPRLRDDERLSCILAGRLCEWDGADAPDQLIWEGNPPEPWGPVWMRYQPKAKEILQLIDESRSAPKTKAPLPEYKTEIGEAGHKYLRSVALDGNYWLPGTFRWYELWDALCKAASTAPDVSGEPCCCFMDERTGAIIGGPCAACLAQGSASPRSGE